MSPMPENPTPPEPPTASPPAPTGSQGRAPLAHLLAWSGLALVNAVAILFLPMPAGGIGIRALHHAYDAGQMIALGLVAALASAAWERFGSARLTYAALAVASAIVALLVLKR